MLATYLRDVRNNLEVVVLGDDPEDYLRVQRALAFDEQDVRLEMDTYCLVVASGATLYGGIRDFANQGTSVRLVFTRQAVESLGVPSEIAADLEGAHREDALRTLRRMLG